MNIPNTANSFEELHEFFNGVPSQKYIWLYRGQANASWKLKPKIGRDEYNVGGTGLDRFRAWKSKAVAHINLPNNEWEQLAIAQHYGLSTFLLDWSENPLVAAFFACHECPDQDGVVYIHAPGKIIDYNIIKSPFYIDDALRDGFNDFPPSLAFYPNAIDKRIINQKGVFTIHSTPQEELKSYEIFDPNLKDNLYALRIKSEAKKDVLDKLHIYGIDNHFLFPDLGGLSEFINYETRGIIEGRKRVK